MKIDKKTITSLLSLPDDKLLQMIKLITGSIGADTSGIKIKPETMSGLRALLSEVTDADLERAGELIEIYKKNKK